MIHGERSGMVTIPNYSTDRVAVNRATMGNLINKTTFEFSYKGVPDQLDYSSSNLT